MTTLGDFELLDELGRGGMGVVYRARQVSLDREVAVKVLPAEAAGQGQVAARFAVEARRMAALDHPHIAHIYLVGEEGGQQYFAMQYLRGGSLEDRLRQGPLAWPQAVEIAAQVAEALDYAHERGIVHRDVKPANIMFDEQGRAVVTDFGIAKAADDVRLTATGISVGTPQYMAPEQARGNPVDGRADLYALGVVLYEMLCGRPPFEGQTAVSIALKHMNEAPLSPRRLRADVPEWLESVVLKALAKEPVERFLTGADMARALRSQVQVQAPTVMPAYHAAPPTTLMPIPKGGNPVGLKVLVAVLALLGCAALGVVVFKATAKTPAPGNPGGAPPPGNTVGVSPTRTTVPSVVGLSAARAEDALRAGAGFQPMYNDPCRSDTIPEGSIVRQLPMGGAYAEPGDVVYLVKSLGPAPPSELAIFTNSGEGYSIGHPPGWTMEGPTVSDGYTRIRFVAPGGDALMLVDSGPAGSGDSVADFRSLSDRFAKVNGPPYRLLELRSGTLDGKPGAYWEFEITKEGESWHKMDVSTDTMGHGYAVLVQAHPEVFGSYRALFQRIIGSFRIL